jgi:Flp pilus assembly protein TadD
MFPALSLAMAMPALAGCSMFRMAEAPQAQVTLRVADAALASGAPDVALRIATLVLQKHPDNIAALVAKGDALYAVGAVEQARAAYSLAVAADAGDVGAQIGLGRTLVRSDPHAAETHFIAAAANQTDNVIALNDLGIARDMQGHHAEAQQAYRQALAVMPDMADVKTNLDLSLSLSGEGRQAVQVLEKIVTASEATPLDRADLAMAQNDAGPAGPVKEQVVQTATTHYDTEPIAIMPALITSVESRPLEPRQPGPVAKPEAMVRPAPPPTAPRQTKVVAEGIYVQMASLDSEQAARTEWQKLRTRWPDLLGNRGPSVMQADVHDRKFWRLRTGGFPSVGEANDFCAKLRAAGSGCWTVGPASKS